MRSENMLCPRCGCEEWLRPGTFTAQRTDDGFDLRAVRVESRWGSAIRCARCLFALVPTASGSCEGIALGN